ncbi:unknown [Odoribacter laneus CAG:561]|nr:unknown [Odoribacter laneus CAG:561]
MIYTETVDERVEIHLEFFIDETGQDILAYTEGRGNILQGEFWV